MKVGMGSRVGEAAEAAASVTRHVEPAVEAPSTRVATEAQDSRPTGLRRFDPQALARSAASRVADTLVGVQAVLSARTGSELALLRGTASLPYHTVFRVEKPLDAVASLYAQWAVGSGVFEGQSRAKGPRGLPPEMTHEDVYPREVTYNPPVNGGCSLWSRSDGDRWCLKWQHWSRIELHGRDAMALNPREALHRSVGHWEHCVELSREGGVTRVEHAIQLVTPEPLRQPPFPEVPGIIRLLVGENPQSAGVPWAPRQLPQDLSEAEAFVRGTLLAESRRHPVLVVTEMRTEDGWERLVDPADLARMFVGVAQVVSVEAPERFSKDAFMKAMERSGADRDLNVLDGGVRLYMPGLRVDSAPGEHRLWSKFFWMGRSSDAALAQVAHEVGLETGGRDVPPGFLNAIPRIDRERRELERTKAAEEAQQRFEEERARLREARRSSRRDKTLESADPSLLAQELDSARSELANLRERLRASEAEHHRDAELLSEFERVNDELTRQNRELQVVNSRLEGERDELTWRMGRGAKRPQPAEAGMDRAALAEAVLGGRPSLENALRYLEATFPDRIEVLPSAYSTARKFTEFRHLDRSWDLLRTLATDYWKAMADPGGGGDAKAKGVFGNGYAANEAEFAANSDRGRALRTFSYNGERVQMDRHLRIGTKMDSRGETWRCHFHWDGAARKIVIGHCGEHLDFL